MSNVERASCVWGGPDGTVLVFNDLIFNLPNFPGFMGFVFRLMGSTGGPKVTRIGRLLTVSDVGALRAHLERLASVPDLRRVIIMHGADIKADAAATLRTVAAQM